MKPKQLKYSDLSPIREELYNKQNGICPVCNRKVEIDKVVVDHHHKKRIKGSGLLRGVICRTCNVFLGKIENNCVRYGISYNLLPSVLSNIVSYITKQHLPYIHPSERPRLTKRSYQELKKVMRSDKKKIPPYPKTGMLTKQLSRLFEKYGVEPREE